MEKKGIIAEFKEFALRGNVIDLAVGVIIGAAFQAIVNSLVEDILSPILGLVLQGNLSGLSLNLFDGAVNIRYGAFFMAIVNFFLMALVIFFIVKGINAVRNRGKQADNPEATEQTCPYCQSTISIKATRCPHCTSEIKPLP
ncbi:MAG: large conductance mechanosensitive channel protein MscL [Eubacterium sp.]|nr:large conductance mechanosensitive channel protein MscL [Eubacterium sp.]